MTTETRRELTKDEALARLDPFQEHIDPCANGHVDHDESGHLGRRLIHSFSPRGLGADWDADAVVAFIEASTRIVDVGGSHPLAVFSDGRWIKFEAKPA